MATIDLSTATASGYFTLKGSKTNFVEDATYDKNQNDPKWKDSVVARVTVGKDGAVSIDSLTDGTTVTSKGDVTLGGDGKELTFASGKGAITLTGDKNTVTLGSGEDTLTLSGTGNTVTLGKGKDTVTLKSGAKSTTFTDYDYKNDTIVLDTGAVDDASKASYKGDTITFGDKNTLAASFNAYNTTDGYVAKVSDGTKSYSYAWLGATDGSIDLSSMTDDFTISAAGVGDVASVIGGKGSDTIDASGAGSASIYGGAGNDSINISGANDAVVFYNGTGKDTVTGYSADNGQVIDFFGGAATGFKRENGAVTVKAGSTNSIKIVTSDDFNTALTYATGTNTGLTQQVKVGVTDASNNFTYDASVKNYIGGNGTDTITVDSTADDVMIGMDSAFNDGYYSNISVLDASAAEGDVTLAGTSGRQTLIGGAGESSLWGGSGSDMLIGGDGATTYFFGKTDDHDTIISTNKEDKVVLYDVALSDINLDQTKVSSSTGALNIALNSGSNLTVNNIASDGVKDFQLADGTTYTYDATSSTWSTK